MGFNSAFKVLMTSIPH